MLEGLKNPPKPTSMDIEILKFLKNSRIMNRAPEQVFNNKSKYGFIEA